MQKNEKENENDEKRKMKKCSNVNSRKQSRVQSRITYWMKKERNDDEKCEKDERNEENDEKNEKDDENDVKEKVKIEKRKEKSVKMKLEQDIDNKTPKSKFKSVLKKFEDKVNDEREIEQNEVTEDARNPENSDKLRINLVNDFKSLGESWKGRFMETQLPSSVRKQRKSAAVCARGG